MKETLAVLTLALLCACSQASSEGAASASGPSTGPAALSYLSWDAIEVETALPSPPVVDTSQYLNDVSEVFGFQSSRTPADCERASRESTEGLAQFFGAPNGPLNSDQISQWTPFFERVAGDSDYFAFREKKFWRRTRPFVDDPGIHPCAPLKGDSSYPSANAAVARVFADILSTLNPGEKSQFMNRADQIAIDRVFAGLVYRSDVEAGQKLGDAVFQALLQSDTFERDLNALSRPYRRLP